jgi:hypothetical protein
MIFLKKNKNIIIFFSFIMHWLQWIHHPQSCARACVYFFVICEFSCFDDHVCYKKIKLLTKVIITVLHGEKHGCNVSHATLCPWPDFPQKLLLNCNWSRLVVSSFYMLEDNFRGYYFSRRSMLPGLDIIIINLELHVTPREVRLFPLLLRPSCVSLLPS